MITLLYMFLCMLNYGKCPYEIEVYNCGEEGGNVAAGQRCISNIALDKIQRDTFHKIYFLLEYLKMSNMRLFTIA